MSESQWYEADPRAGLEWASEFLVADLLAQATELRGAAEFLEMKASLLLDILRASLSAQNTSDVSDKVPGRD